MPGTNQARRPISLVAGGTAADRRLLSGILVANGAPATVDAGVAVGGAKDLHLCVQHDGVSVDYRVWVYLGFAGKWVPLRSLGTGGVVTVAAANSPDYRTVQVLAPDRVYIEIVTATGPFTAGIDAWVGGNSHP